MRDFVLATGMILEVGPVNDYDRRLVILTKEYGKITAFAKGARRQNSRFMAATNPFCFGNFKLYEGKSAYNVADIEVTHYFEELRADFEGAYLGMYFLEIASYYTRENNDEILMLKLLFQSMRAIVKESIDNRLVRAIFEIKSIVINGEFPGIPTDKKLSDGCVHAIEYVVNTPVEKLFSFKLEEEVLVEFKDIATYYRSRMLDKTFKSLQIIDGFEQ